VHYVLDYVQALQLESQFLQDLSRSNHLPLTQESQLLVPDPIQFKQELLQLLQVLSVVSPYLYDGQTVKH
jgi:hypothetical protein